VLDWLRTPRPQAEPGVWRLGHRARPDEEPDLVPARQLFSGAFVAYLCGWLLWSLLWNGYLEGWWFFVEDWWLLPMLWVVPEVWRTDPRSYVEWYALSGHLYNALVLGLLAFGFGRVGNWKEVWQRYGVPLWPLFVFLPGVWRETPRNIKDAEAFTQTYYFVYYLLLAAAVVAVVGRVGTWPVVQRRRARAAGTEPVAGPTPPKDPADWPELRAAGLGEVAGRLAEAARAGSLGDVDYARIRRAWQGVHARPERLAAFADTVRRHGPAACAHPSGLRDLPVRTATHDLATGQVKIGTVVDDGRNPYARSRPCWARRCWPSARPARARACGSYGR
jgi:hypothetical protein